MTKEYKVLNFVAKKFLFINQNSHFARCVKHWQACNDEKEDFDAAEILRNEYFSSQAK